MNTKFILIFAGLIIAGVLIKTGTSKQRKKSKKWRD